MATMATMAAIIRWRRSRCASAYTGPATRHPDAMNATALLHLLQLSSPSLPIGAYSYSQGLEAALESGLVRDEASARDWIAEALRGVVARFEAPVLWRLLQAFERADQGAVQLWTERFLAARDTAEFRAETVQMGYSLGKLLAELKLPRPELPALLQSLP